MSVSGRDPDAQGPTPIDLLQERIHELEKAARDLLQYLDEHDWGHVPEGATADRLRDLVTPQETACDESTNPGGTGLEQSPSDCGDGRGDSGLTPGAAGGRRAPGNAISTEKIKGDVT